MKKTILKAVIDTCDVLIEKIDTENKEFFSETGFSEDEKKNLIKYTKTTEKAVETSLRTQYKDILNNLSEFKKQGKIKKYVTKAADDDEKTQREVEAIATLILSLIWIESKDIGNVISDMETPLFIAMATSALNAFGYKWNVDRKAARMVKEWLKSYADDIATVLNNSTKDMLRRIITTAVRNNIGKSLTTILTAVEDKIKQFAKEVKKRARLIAQNESLKISNNARYLAALAARKKKKRWTTRADNKVRTAHKAAHGQTVDIKDNFIVNGEPLKYPGDPSGSISNTIRCRCWVEYL